MNSWLLREICEPSTLPALYLEGEMKTPFTVILRIGHSVQKRKTTQQGFRYEKNSLLNIRIQRQDYLVVS